MTLGFAAEVGSSTYGVVSAIKLFRSVMIKGVEALAIESLLAARHSVSRARYSRRSRRHFRASRWLGFAPTAFSLMQRPRQAGASSPIACFGPHAMRAPAPTRIRSWPRA